MHTNEKQLLKELPKQVKLWFAESPLGLLPFHNLKHTRSIVRNVRKIADYHLLPKKDVLLVETATWFCCIGWSYEPINPAATAVELMRSYLSKQDVSTEHINLVAELINLFHSSHHPSGLLEEICYDAVTAYLGQKSFYKNCRLLQQEEGQLSHNVSPKSQWLSNMIESVERHHFYTAYGRTVLEPRKLVNLTKLKRKLVRAEEKKDRPEKGIETMFRITSSNNQRLSDMADQKAHLLITINSIILSAIISLVLRRLEKFDFLLYPTIFLLTSCLAAMTLAILATRPSIPHGTFAAEDIKKGKVNLLFFGNFYRMSLDDYLNGMFSVMDDNGLLYRTLVTDVYGQGIVLGKKYSILRTAYSIFMFGSILSVLAFIAATVLHQNR